MTGSSSTTDDLRAAREEIFASAFVVAQHLTRRVDAELVGLGLTAHQWLLLAILVRSFDGHSPSLTEAAERYGSSRQNVKQIALGLERRGWVRLVPDPADARTTRLQATDKVAVFDSPEMERRAAAMLDDVTAGLSRDQVLALRDLIRPWLAALTGAGIGRPSANDEESRP